MQIYGAYTRGIQGHLFTVSATPIPAGRLHIADVRDTVAQQTATTVTHALKHLGMRNVGADVRLEPAGPGDPPLATGQYSDTLELPIALALLAVAGKLPSDRLAGTVAVGGLDPYAANENAGVRCIGGRGTTAIAHAAHSRGLRLIVAEDQAAAACVECGETTSAATLDELVAVLASDRNGDPLPPRTAIVKRRDPGTWRVGEGDLRALEIACAGWHNIPRHRPRRALPPAVRPHRAGPPARPRRRGGARNDHDPRRRGPHGTVDRAADRAPAPGPALHRLAGRPRRQPGPARRGQPRAQWRPRHRPADRVRPRRGRSPRRRRRGRTDRHLPLHPRRAHDPGCRPASASW